MLFGVLWSRIIISKCSKEGKSFENLIIKEVMNIQIQLEPVNRLFRSSIDY